MNNSLLSVVLAVLGLFLTAVSLRLSSVIQSKSECLQKASLNNVNRLILIVGIVLFMSAVGYLLCKRSCSGSLSVESSISDVMFLGFNLVLGIVIIVLFSMMASLLNNCNAQLSGFDSRLVVFGIIIGVISTGSSLMFFGKRLYDNKAQVSGKMQNMLSRSSSPARSNMNSPVRYMDPFGYDD